MARPSDSGGSALGWHAGFQRPKTKSSGEIAQRVDGEGGGGAGRRHDEAADRRPDAAGEVEVDAVQRHRRRQRRRAAPSRRRRPARTGLLSAVPQPIRKVKVSSSQGVIRPGIGAGGQRDRHREHEALRDRASRGGGRNCRRSAPAASEKIMIGSEVEACTSATMSAEPVIEVISQAAPTDWIRPPRLDARLAIQTARKIVWLNGASADGRSFIVLRSYPR